MRRGYFSEQDDEEVDEVLDYNDEAMGSPTFAMRYPMSPLRSPSAAVVEGGEGGDNMYASQTLSEVSEIEEDLDEGGLEDEEYHSASLGKPVAIRPMRLSPDFFTGFGRAAHRAGGHSRGSNGGLDSPVTPGMADDKPQCVLPGLFIGALEAARNINALSVAGITHVLTLGMGMDLPEVEKRLESHRVIAVEDKVSEQTSLATHLNECMDYIHECRASGGKVLVHCLAGRSRSASIVAAYLMVHNKCGVDEALTQLRLVRPWIAPNEGFLDMLRAFQDNPTFSMPTQQVGLQQPDPAHHTSRSGSSDSGTSGISAGRQLDGLALPGTAGSVRSGSAASTGSDGVSSSGSGRGASSSPPAAFAATSAAGGRIAAGGGGGSEGGGGAPIAAPLVGLPSGGMSGGFDPSKPPPALQGSDAAAREGIDARSAAADGDSPTVHVTGDVLGGEES